MNKIFFALLSTISFGICHANTNEQQTFPLSTPPKQSEIKKTTEEEGFILFTPPEGWQMADANVLPSHVRVMIIGKGPSSFPPSLNLSWEPYQGTIKQYLKIVNNMNAAEGYTWRDLGTIQTQAGTGSLSQVDTKTQWGNVRLMHVIMIKNGHVYILTASALQEEFSLFYKDFFAAMRSLRIVNNAYEMITNPQQRNQVQTAANKLQSQWQTLIAQKQTQFPQMSLSDIQDNVFNSEEFQTTIWNPFKDMLKQKTTQLGADWHALFLQKLEDQLFNMNA
jgi:hypothetical protein